VTTEKIHGANFSLNTDGATVRPAKRTGFLANTDKFYNFQVVVSDLTPIILKGFEATKKVVPDLQEVVFFGELFGGAYPHEKVPKDPRFPIHVQKGVYYSPAVHFYLFDIFIPGKSYLNFDTFQQVAQESGFFYSKPLQRGKYADLIKFDVDTFVSTIPKQLGLPEMPKPNISEGIVIKLVHNRYTTKGTRVLVKHKSESFKEVTGVYNTKDPADKKAKVYSEPPLPPEIAEFRENMKRYVNENRLRNVLSKLGPVENKESAKSKLVGLMAKDVLEEFGADFPKWKQLKKEEQKRVTSSLGNLVLTLVARNWTAIVKGEF